MRDAYSFDGEGSSYGGVMPSRPAYNTQSDSPAIGDGLPPSWEEIKTTAGFDKLTSDEQSRIYRNYIKEALPAFAGASGTSIEELTRQFTSQVKDPRIGSRGVTGWATDAGVGLAKGVVSLGKSVTDFVDPTSGASDTLGQWDKSLGDSYSDVEKAHSRDRELLLKRIDNDPSKTQLEKEAAKFGTSLKNLSAGQLFELVGNIAPTLLATGGVGLVARGFGLGGRALTATTAGSAAVINGVAAGGDAGGGAYEDVKNLPIETLRKNADFVALADQVGETKAREQFAIDAWNRGRAVGGVVGGALGPLGTELAIAKRTAGKATAGRLATAGKEALSEGAEEGLTQAGQNYGVQRADDSRSLLADTGQSVALGMLGGASGLVAGGGKASPASQTETSGQTEPSVKAQPLHGIEQSAIDAAVVSPGTSIPAIEQQSSKIINAALEQDGVAGLIELSKNPNAAGKAAKRLVDSLGIGQTNSVSQPQSVAMPSDNGVAQQRDVTIDQPVAEVTNQAPAVMRPVSVEPAITPSPAQYSQIEALAKGDTPIAQQAQALLDVIKAQQPQSSEQGGATPVDMAGVNAPADSGPIISNQAQPIGEVSRQVRERDGRYIEQDARPQGRFGRQPESKPFTLTPSPIGEANSANPLAGAKRVGSSALKASTNPKGLAESRAEFDGWLDQLVASYEPDAAEYILQQIEKAIESEGGAVTRDAVINQIEKVLNESYKPFNGQREAGNPADAASGVISDGQSQAPAIDQTAQREANQSADSGLTQPSQQGSPIADDGGVRSHGYVHNDKLTSHRADDGSIILKHGDHAVVDFANGTPIVLPTGTTPEQVDEFVTANATKLFGKDGKVKTKLPKVKRNKINKDLIAMVEKLEADGTIERICT